MILNTIAFCVVGFLGMEVFVVSPGFLSKTVGYRLVEVGEIYEGGDEDDFMFGKWTRIDPRENKVGRVYHSLLTHGHYRRPIEREHPFLACPAICCNEGRVL